MSDSNNESNANSPLAIQTKDNAPLNLDKFIAQRGAIPWRNCMKALFDLCFDLEARLSAKEGVHGGLAMDSFIVRSADGESEVTIGLASADSQGAQSSLFFAESYMSPEECLKRKTDNRSDVYSLGCVLYHCLTGSPPFVHSNREHLKELQVIEYPLAPGRRYQRIRIPDEVDNLVLKCLEKDPAKRFQNAQQLRAEIGKTLQIDDAWEESQRVTGTDRKIFLTICLTIAVLATASALLYNAFTSPDFIKIVQRSGERRRQRYFLPVETGPAFLKQMEFKNGAPTPDRDPLELKQKGNEVVLFATTLRTTIKDALMEATRRKLLLTAVDLEGADLKGATIHAALPHAFLDKATCDDADLFGSLLNRASCNSATFRRAKLARVTLSEAQLMNADFENADLTGAVLLKADAKNAIFRNTRLDGAMLLGANLEGADFTNASMKGTALSKNSPALSKLSKLQLSQVMLVEDQDQTSK